MAGFPSEEIKSRLDVADVISAYIRLQKKGANWSALCPFHNEKTPSFHVSGPRQMWHCFGCGEGGDMFKFVMKMEGVEFVDALRVLAKKAGVVLQAQDPKLASEKAQLLEICTAAVQYFRNNFTSDAGKEAREYLQKRGLADETIEMFRIGYALDSWDGLYQFLSIKGYKAPMIERAGLVAVSEKSGTKKYYDRFRGRIMFPIADHNGDVIAFTGRYITEREGEGKYVNSPQGVLYNKSAVLYGLDKTKMEIRKTGVAVLVEGQMDMIMAYQDGVKNVVAVSGTAFTPQHLLVLKRYAPTLCILFDADPAGDMATRKSIALALAQGFTVTVGKVPGEKDPADFVFDHPGKLEKEIQKAVSVMEYYFDSVFAKYNAKKLDDKKIIAGILLAQIKKLPNKVEAHHWLEQLSGRLGTRMEYLEDEMRSLKTEDEFIADMYARGEEKTEKPVMRRTNIDKLVEHILSLAYAAKDKAAFTKAYNVIVACEFAEFLRDVEKGSRDLVNEDTRAVFDLFIKYGKIDGTVSDDAKQELSETAQNLLSEILLTADIAEYENIEAELVSSARRMENEVNDSELRRLESEVRQEKDDVRRDQLFREVRERGAKKMQLASQKASA